MNWDEAAAWLERLKSSVQVLSVLGPYVIWPALLYVYRLGHRLRQLFHATPKILRALAIFGNRERRAFDVDRRLLYFLRRLVVVLRVEGKRLDFTRDSGEALEEITAALAALENDIQELRDTGLRAREIKMQRERRDSEIRARGASAVEIDQGELDAAVVGPIERALGD